MKKNSALLMIVIIIMIILVIYVIDRVKPTPITQKNSTPPRITPLPPIKYGIIDFSNTRITYPLVFEDITVTNNSITFGPQNWYAQDFQIFLMFEKRSLKETNERKTDMIMHTPIIKVDSPQTGNGYQGELLADDLRVNPDPNTENCTIDYWYIVSLTDKQNALWLRFSVSQPRWQGMSTPTYKCSLYNAPYYSYFLSILDHIIFKMIPSD